MPEPACAPRQPAAALAPAPHGPVAKRVLRPLIPTFARRTSAIANESQLAEPEPAARGFALPLPCARTATPPQSQPPTPPPPPLGPPRATPHYTTPCHAMPRRAEPSQAKPPSPFSPFPIPHSPPVPHLLSASSFPPSFHHDPPHLLPFLRASFSPQLSLTLTPS